MASPSAILADQVWQALVIALNRGEGPSIRIPDAYKPLLGREGMDIIVARYSHLLGVPAVLKDDTATTGIISIQPTQTTWGPAIREGSPEEEGIVSKKARLPRPPNAFILYRQHHHPIVKEAHPDLHNNQISIILGKQWKNEDTVTKALYKRQADNLKKKHMEDHPDYQYQPRKPAEKKRRMTRRKAEALASHNGPREGPSTQGSSLPTDTSLAIGHPLTPPAFEKTPAGNAVVTLGSEGFDVETFEDLLKNFNESVTTARPEAVKRNHFIVTERTEKAQSDFTFSEEEFVEMQAVLMEMDEEIGADETTVFGSLDIIDDTWNTMDHHQQTNQWDVVHQQDPNTELQRYSTVFEEDFD